MGKKLLALLPIAILCGGCRTVYRPRFDISPNEVRSLVRQVDGGPYVVVEVRRVSVPELAANITSGKRYQAVTTIDGAVLMPELNRLFPSVFADTPDAVPIVVRQIVRSGTLAEPDRMSPFNGVAALNRNLSRKDRSEMSQEGFFQGTVAVNGIVSGLTLFLIPLYGGPYASRYDVDVMTGYDRYDGAVSYAARAGQWVVNELWLPFLRESDGWVHGQSDPQGQGGRINLSRIAEAPDATSAAKQTALCSAILKSLAAMSPDARAALRRNPIALLLDKEKGNDRAFRLVQVSAGAGERTERTDALPNRPAILGQSYDAATRKGSIRFDVSKCDDPDKALAWVRDSYVPLVASGHGVAIDASAPGSPPSGRFAITGLRQKSADVYQLDFVVRE